MAGNDLQEIYQAPYSEDDEADDWDFAKVSRDSYVDGCAFVFLDFDVTLENAWLANVIVLEIGNGLLSLMVQNLNALSENIFAIAAKTEALDLKTCH